MSLTPDLLGQSLKESGLEGFFSQDSLSSLAHFSLKMLEVNEIINLTKWIEDGAFLTHHLLDSALALPVLKPLVKDGGRWMDLGTGCGFPGAVLMAAFPNLEVTLMDSVAKKIHALGECLDSRGMEIPDPHRPGRRVRAGSPNPGGLGWSNDPGRRRF